jgi:glucokinase
LPHVSGTVLLADIGGTHSRFALKDPHSRLSRVLSIRNDEVAGLEAAIERYIAHVGARPSAAVLAIAGPINGDEIALTNRAWHFRLDDIKARFGLNWIRAVNDFEAQAWALLTLGPGDTTPIGGVTGSPQGIRLVLGPGTGLGVAALVPFGATWLAVASEGGHVSFGPATDDEEPVFARLRSASGYVSAETILSGPGLMRLHAAVHRHSEPQTSEAIIAAAQAGDRAAQATLRLFVRLLGRFAGGAALMFKASGGVYVSGGLGTGLGALLDGGVFRAAFEAHPPHQKTLARIPTCLVTASEPGLLGCAALANARKSG